MTLRAVVRASARLGLAGVICMLAALVAVQFARIVAQNVAYARQLHDVRTEIVTLEQTRARRLREIRRLSDPRGAIPEIHDRLHLVGDHEAIIYLKRPAPPPSGGSATGSDLSGPRRSRGPNL